MSMFPGLCGELAAVPYRVYLGALPAMAVEERFLRQVQAVFPWYTSRKRVKEQANTFMEIDLASCDPEILLRYTHVYYARRQLHDELIDKQLTLIESGKAPKVADSALLVCLNDCNAHVAQRLQYELYLLREAKRACCAPHRRELNPDSPLESYDYLCMMRVVEENACGIEDAERKSQAYLPVDLIEAKARALGEQLHGAGAARALDKKEQKLIQRLIPGDYSKVGCVDKVRPVDVAAFYRFYGERVLKTSSSVSGAESGAFFKKSLWAHIYRKFASHPAYLSSISCYWARHSGLDANSPLTAMPAELARAVCVQQSLFPALKFRSQFLYTSPDIARQQWRTDSVVPLMRLFPAFGAQAAEDLAAAMVVEGEWARLGLASAEANPLQEGTARTLREFAEHMGSMYETNMEAALKRVEEGCKIACPALTEREARQVIGGEVSESETVASASVSA